MIIKEKPDFLIAHLIISLPLILFFFKFDTKLIIKFLARQNLICSEIFWKLFSKNVYLVTCPTNSTLQKLKELNIFPKKKLKLVYDPILKVSAINMKKREKLQDKLVGTEFILSIGD